MALKPTTRRPVGKQAVTPRRKGRPPAPAAATAALTGTPATPQPATLAQQNADFTAEGSPPPGRVSTAVPAGPRHPQGTGPARKKR